jgi:hypothetical protein
MIRKVPKAASCKRISAELETFKDVADTIDCGKYQADRRSCLKQHVFVGERTRP